MSISELPVLFKKKNMWSCEVVDKGEHAEIIVKFGKIDGKLQEKITIIDSGKNVGKANETSYLEQAILEAKSKWNKQIDKLYSVDRKEIEKEFRPMLAKSFEDFEHKVSYPCFVQPKLDGCRLVTTTEKFMSRNGKEWNTLSHLEDETRVMLDRGSSLGFDVILDGELYLHNKSFQNIISAIKRDETNAESENIEYWVYDIFVKNVPEMPFSNRKELLVALFKGQNKVKNVPTYVANNKEEVEKLYKTFVEFGFEGAMIRNSNSVYRPDKRSEDLLKFKRFFDEEFEIVSHEEDKNGHAVFYCVTEKGALFKVKPVGSDEDRREYLENATKYYNKMMTVRFFEWTSSQNPVPRFPVGIIRDYE